MKYVIATILSLALVPAAASAATVTYAGPTAMNIDKGTAQNYDFFVTGTGKIDWQSVFVQTGGSYADDVSFSLSHLGTTVMFYKGIGDTYSSTINATFKDSAAASAPANGSAAGAFKPTNSFSAFSGLDIAGKYTFSTIDKVVPGDGTKLLASSITIAAAAVPEPATWAMMIGGFGAIGGTMRRRQKVATAVRFA